VHALLYLIGMAKLMPKDMRNSTSIAPINHRHKEYQPFTLGKKEKTI